MYCLSRTLHVTAIAQHDTINIINTYTRKTLYTITLPAKQEISTISFMEETPYLFVATYQGSLYQYRYDAPLALSGIDLAPYPIDTIVTYKDKVFVTCNNEIIAIDGYTLIQTHYAKIKTAKITALYVVDDAVLVATTADEKLLFLNYQNKKIIKSLTSPFGIISAMAEVPYSQFLLLYNRSHMLVLLDTTKQKIVSNPFMVFEKTLLFCSMLNAKTLHVMFCDQTEKQIDIFNVKRFEQAVKNKDIKEALLLAQNNPLLETTLTYKQMQQLYNNLYKDTFLAYTKKDQKLFEKNLLLLQALPQKKEDLQMLLRCVKIYEDFQHAVMMHKTFLVQSFCDKYPLLRITPECIKYKFQKQPSITKEDTTHKTDSSTDTINTLLYDSYQNNDFVTCYELLDRYPELQNNQYAILLEKHWKKIIKKCEEYALKTQLQKIKATLQELIMIETRSLKIGSILRLSFQTKIIVLLDTNAFAESERMLYAYLDIFGDDKVIQTLIKNYSNKTGKQLAIMNKEDLDKPHDAWRKCVDIVDDFSS